MGDLDAQHLHRLFATHASRLVLYARQWLPFTQAEDVVQEVFIRLLQQRREPQDVKAWLFASVRNAAISQSRSDQRRARRERRVAEERAWFKDLKDQELDTFEAEQSLRMLPESQREVVVLRIWGEMTYQQMAELTGLPLSTIYDQYRSALTAMRKRLESPCTKNP